MIRTVLALGFIVAFCPPVFGANGDIIMLGTLPNETSSIPVSLNGSGQVAGYSGTDRSFIWSSSSGISELTQIDSLIDVSDINNAGMIVGRVWWPGKDWQGFLWDPIQGQTNLGSLGGVRSEPAAVNNSGTVVGKSVNSGYIERAFRWTATGGMEDLGALGGTFASSAAMDISDTGVIVGRSDFGPHAFRWTADTGMVDLQTLGGSRSIAYGISPNGNTIVGWADDAQGAMRPFRWTEQAGMQDLSTPGGIQGLATAVNDSGAVVGEADGASGNFRPTLWTSMLSQPIELNAWLAANNPAAAANWHIEYAELINDSGLIAGFGTYYPGGYPAPLRAFVLDVSGVPGVVPEPATIGCAIGFAIMGLLHRWRHQSGAHVKIDSGVCEADHSMAAKRSNP